VRLAKYLAHAGVASRRASEDLIRAGRVSVDRQIVTDPATDVDQGNDVAVDGEPVKKEPREVHILNKPKGVVSTAEDTHGRPTVTDYVQTSRRLYPVGRLDADTTGLILLTNDGELANRLTHPKYGVAKTYRVRVKPEPVRDHVIDKLRNGIVLDDGPTQPAKIRQTKPGVLEISIKEGRKRQVRRMFEAVGHKVVQLERIQFGPVRLKGLEPGAHRRLTPVEVEALWKNQRP
jgi:23S rRNA pseudouridine2605 synthase